VLVPIVGIGAFLWWAGRDIMKGTVRLLHYFEKLLALSTFTLFKRWIIFLVVDLFN